MNRVFIPSHLQHLTEGHRVVSVEGSSVRRVIRALDCAYPGIAERLQDRDALKAGIAVAIDGMVADLGLYASVDGDSEVFFILAIEGG
jgi:hypothetical protein